MSLASGIMGGIKARKAAKAQNALLDKEEKDNQNWFDRRYNEDYTQSAEAQASLQRAKEMTDELYKKQAGASAVSGATDESVAQQKAVNNQTIADTTSNIAANATAQKNNIENRYLDTKNSINNQRLSLLTQQQQAATQQANQGMQAGMGMVGADQSSMLQTGKGLFGNLFGGKG